MSNLAKIEFVVLNILGKNYLSWLLDAMNLGNTIKLGNDASLQDHTRALIFFRHHIDKGLKGEYLTVKYLFILWNNINEQYDHQKIVILLKARYDWMHLVLQDFKFVSDYNSTLFKISSQLNCVEKKSLKKICLKKH